MLRTTVASEDVIESQRTVFEIVAEGLCLTAQYRPKHGYKKEKPIHQLQIYKVFFKNIRHYPKKLRTFAVNLRINYQTKP